MNLELPAEWFPSGAAWIPLVSLIAIIVLASFGMREKNSKTTQRVLMITGSVLACISVIGLSLGFTQYFQTKQNLKDTIAAQAEQVYGVRLSNSDAGALTSSKNQKNYLTANDLDEALKTDTLYGEVEIILDGEVTSIRLASLDNEFILLNNGAQDAVELERVQ